MGLFGKSKGSKKEEGTINYSSLFTSMEKGNQLFNQLKIRCHPDRFIGTDKQKLAEEIFKLVQVNSTDYARLLELKERIDNEL